jgi:alkylmercury lyase
MTTLADIAASIIEHTPPLDTSGRRVALATYRALASGEPAPVDRIAQDASVQVDEATQWLAGVPGVFRDDERRVVGFWGLSVERFGPHRLRVDGVELSAWCAWDTLFLPELLRRTADVHSRSPLDDASIVLRVSPQRVERAPDGLLVSMVRSRESDDMVRTFCHHIHFFASPAEGERWIAERDGAVLISGEEAFELGREINRARYGASGQR